MEHLRILQTLSIGDMKLQIKALCHIAGPRWQPAKQYHFCFAEQQLGFPFGLSIFLNFCDSFLLTKL
jgi:hypothetical protein